MEYIDAKKARELSDTSDKMFNRIMKCIKECANDGCTRINWGVTWMSPANISLTEKKLKDLGFTVEILRDALDEAQEMQVSW